MWTWCFLKQIKIYKRGFRKLSWWSLTTSFGMWPLSFVSQICRGEEDQVLLTLSNVEASDWIPYYSTAAGLMYYCSRIVYGTLELLEVRKTIWSAWTLQITVCCVHLVVTVTNNKYTQMSRPGPNHKSGWFRKLYELPADVQRENLFVVSCDEASRSAIPVYL